MSVGDKTHPAETVTRKPDDDVGTSGTAATGGGKQTPEQAAITGTGGGGRDEGDRRSESGRSGDEAGRAPDPVGGASQGHAEQKSAGDGPGESSAKGHYKVEKAAG